MEFVSDKVTSFTGTALSEVRNKWIHQQQQQQHQTQEATASNSNAIQTQQIPLGQTGSARMTKTNANYEGSPLAGGFPFGGDSHSRRRYAFPPPPPIGFRTDLLLTQAGATRHQPEPAPAPAAGSPAPSVQPQAQPEVLLDVSSESLYQGDAWSRLWFQRVMILCLLRLLLFIRKVYEDFQATKVYNLTGQRGHFIIAATTLFMPTIVFTIYRVARYLQLTLPPLRANKQQPPPKRETDPKREEDAAGSPSSFSTVAHGKTTTKTSNDEEAQLRRALMSSPDQSGGMSTPVGGAAAEDDGLVTARQTPTNMEEFHDSKSQQGSIVESATEEAASQAAPRPPPRRLNDVEAASLSDERPAKLESINVDKMGDLPDRETVRVFVGASEQLLHGVLFIFWQLKRQVDVMGYLVDRACLWRKPAEREKEELNRMNCHRDGLEWFQDFYAAFLAILDQVYTLGVHWSSSTGDERANQMKHLSATQLNAAISGLASAPEGPASSGSDSPASQSARVVSSILSTQAFALAGKDILLMSELIVSSVVVLSLLICVRRRDDGPLTLSLSMLGWGSLFAARIIIIALAFVHIGWLIMLPLVILHIVFISGWIYSIALDSHNNLASEMEDEVKWDEEAAIEQQQQRQDAIELNETVSSEVLKPSADESAGQSQTPTTANNGQQLGQLTKATTRTRSITSNWSLLEHLVLLAQILTLFAIPSLFYWPIMFNLKLHLRPFKYLVLVLTQNFLLIPAIWFTISAQASATPGQLYLLGAVGAFSVIGFIFVSLYVACKPSLTEYFARADELFNEAEKSGIYYEFCSRVFRMPDLSKGAFRRLMNQTEEIVEEQEEE